MRSIKFIILTAIVILLITLCHLTFLQGTNPFWGFKDEMRKKSGIDKKIVTDLLKREEFLPKITYPTEGSIVSSPLAVKGTISTHIDYIELKIDDGQWMKISQKPDWSITINSLDIGTHTIHAHAVENDIKGPDISLTFNVAFMASGVSASDDQYDKISITWNSVTGVEKYYIYRSLTAGSGYVEITNITSTSYDDTATGAGTNYYYKVKAWSTAEGFGPYSDYDVGIKLDLFSGVTKREMVSVPGGTFTQTDIGANSFSHTISAFQMGKYEVTYELWYAVYSWATANGYTFANAGAEGHDGTAGDPPTGAKYEPAATINWRDAIVWCNAYSEMSGYSPVYKNGSSQVIKDSRNSNAAECDNAVPDWSANGYRLPTEGEWQYAASYKDGVSWTPPNYASGATDDYNNAGATWPVSWYNDNSSSKTHDVGTKTANALGIHDMSGNVWEWCWDWYASWPGTGQTDYSGSGSGSHRVGRGGSWADSADRLQVGYRFVNFFPYYEFFILGFRLVRTE